MHKLDELIETSVCEPSERTCKMPLIDYLNIVAVRNGFDSVRDMYGKGVKAPGYTDITIEDIEEYDKSVHLGVLRDRIRDAVYSLCRKYGAEMTAKIDAIVDVCIKDIEAHPELEKAILGSAEMHYFVVQTILNTWH